MHSRLFLITLSTTGCIGLGIAAYKMFSIDLPEELKSIKYPLRAKEAILKSMHAKELRSKVEHLMVAKEICKNRYGQISPQYTNLLAYEADILRAFGDCNAMADHLNVLIKKPHVGEAVGEELVRWRSAKKIHVSMTECCPELYFKNTEILNMAIERLPAFIKEQINK
jgi:hypothetical protein